MLIAAMSSCNGNPTNHLRHRPTLLPIFSSSMPCKVKDRFGDLPYSLGCQCLVWGIPSQFCCSACSPYSMSPTGWGAYPGLACCCSWLSASRYFFAPSYSPGTPREMQGQTILSTTFFCLKLSTQSPGSDSKFLTWHMHLWNWGYPSLGHFSSRLHKKPQRSHCSWVHGFISAMNYCWTLKSQLTCHAQLFYV
jgi:hypothetical protein